MPLPDLHLPTVWQKPTLTRFLLSPAHCSLFLALTDPRSDPQATITLGSLDVYLNGPSNSPSSHLFDRLLSPYFFPVCHPFHSLPWSHPGPCPYQKGFHLENQASSLHSCLTPFPGSCSTLQCGDLLKHTIKMCPP